MPANFSDLDDEEEAAAAVPPAPRAAAGTGGAKNTAGGANTLAIGESFDGRFELVGILGKGGAGTVWDARVVGSGDAVALKIVPIPSPTRALRARREISIGMGLEGPHFVRVFDAGIVPPFAYVAMERLEGEDLANRLDRVGRLSVAETLRIGRQLATALASAHAGSLVHRDLKPTNVFLAGGSPHEIVKVLDFGVAKRLGIDARVTASDTLLGAPQYAAPEQIQNARTVDTRADVWSMAAIMYRCLLGRRPFDGAGGALLATVMATPHPNPSSIDWSMPPEVDAVFLRGLAKQPAQRFQTALELIAALEAALSESRTG